MEVVKKEKKVGIIINNNAKIFSNGIIQNAYFIFKCLENIGFKCQFLCLEDNPSKFDYKDISLKQLSLNPLEFDPAEYHTIITVTRGIGEKEYLMLKKEKIFVVTFICGNQLMHHLEDFVRGSIVPGLTTYIGKGVKCDEIWLIPSLEYSLEYVSILRGKPTFIVPHLWSPLFVKESVSKKGKSCDELYYNYVKHPGKKIDIIIVEANLHLLKAAWLPLVCCERLNEINENLIENIYVFNYPSNNTAYTMAADLKIHKKIRFFKRLPMPDIMLHFNSKDTIPIIVSHQILNSLNYVYYEALHFGWPLVHNSPDLGDCGYFYPENNISACVAAIQKAYMSHNKSIELYKDKSNEFLKRVDPAGEEVKKVWNGLMNAGLSKTLSS